MPRPLRAFGFTLVTIFIPACSSPQRQTKFPEERYIYAPPEPCADVTLVTLEQDVRAAVSSGAEVAVEGVPVPSDYVSCTAGGCFGSEQCCNECHNFGGHGVTLHEPGGAEFVVGLSIGACSGFECDMNCHPFGREPRTRYRFVGKIQSPLSNKWVMQVERFCRASP